MKGAMEHAGSTCCCTEEHRWALLVVARRRADSTAALHLKSKNSNKYRITILLLSQIEVIMKLQLYIKYKHQ